MGIYMLNQGLLPAGSLFAGALADIWSAPIAVLVKGLTVLVLSGLVFVVAPSMRGL